MATQMDSPVGQHLANLMNVTNTFRADSLVGMDCSPVATDDGSNGSTCDASPICCENDAIVSCQID